MGRAPCCDKANVKKGPWSPEEDEKLKSYIENHGTGGNWITLPLKIGLKRCGKSCRLRWLNYLRPNIKHGAFSDEEDAIICSLYIAIGSRWSIIAAQLPGRTDNDIKNHWNTKLKTMLLGKHRKNQNRGRARNYLNHATINKQLSAPAVLVSPTPASSSVPRADSIGDHQMQLKHAADHDAKKYPFLYGGSGSHQAQVAPSFTIPQLAMHQDPAFSWIHQNGLPFNDASPTWPNPPVVHHEEGYYGNTVKVEGMNWFYGGMGGFINGTTESIMWSAEMMMNSYDDQL